jgi:hypothetical protein
MPDIFSCKRILAIQAHYDDIDIAIGGLVAQLVKNGAEILYVTVTDDLAGVIDLTLSKEVAAARLESEAEKAYLINVIGAKNLAAVCKEFSTVLLHISTDFIFDGDASIPYTENDIPNP